jgi:DNA-binding MarR family transcriptional regulator
MPARTPRSPAPAGGFIRDYLSYLLAQASYAIYREFDAKVRAAGLSSLEWRVLATLSDGGGLTIGDLAAEVLAQQPTLTKLVDRMERAGLVERRADPGDLRRTLVFETQGGRATVAPLLAAAKAHERTALGAFAPREAEALKRALRDLCEPQAVTPLSRTRRKGVRAAGVSRRRVRGSLSSR